MKFHNTMTRQLEPFTPLKPPLVTIYSCGPTVYNAPHIGNYRTFLFNDVLRRYLKFRGYTVNHVMNLTDVDDKTIRRSIEAGQSLKEFTQHYARVFFEELELLQVDPVEHYPLATDHIGDMLAMIETLDKGGYTYISDGSVYFAIQKFPEYGSLARLEARQDVAGARVEVDEYHKEDPRDFVLWKGRKGEEPFWDSEYGPGRPGWHIECSAMARAILGETVDIHTGAIDLIFPHHTNEIAQSECSGSHPFVRYWLHSEFLNIDNEKMSKSLGNIVGLRGLIDAGHDPLAIRYALVSVHYRKPMSFGESTLTMAASTLQRLNAIRRRLNEEPATGEPRTEIGNAIAEAHKRFIAEMDEDLNAAPALAALFELVGTLNAAMDKAPLAASEGTAAKAFLAGVDGVFGLFPRKEETLDAQVQALIDERIQARKERNFKRSDELRDQLVAQGIVLEDTKDGTRWKRKAP